MEIGNLWAALLVFLAVLVGILKVVSQLPQTTKLELQTWPGIAQLIYQALIGMLSRRKSNKHTDITVALVQPTRFDAQRLAGFHRLAHYPSTGGTAPLMYPICESFRLNIQAMLLPAFPYRVLGSVLARHTTTMTRPLGAEEALVYRARVDPASRITPKGHTEVDIVTEAWAVPPGSKGSISIPPTGATTAPVWRSVITVIILTGSPKRSAPPPANSVAADTAPAAQPWVQVEAWGVGADAGRRYGLLNGDLNPIHLWPLTSNLFGFKRPIAHALFLMTRVEASLRSAGVTPVYPARFAASFKRPTLLPARLQTAWRPAVGVGGAGGGGGVSLVEAAKVGLVPGGAGLAWAVLTEDGAKEVMVGSLSVDSSQ